MPREYDTNTIWGQKNFFNTFLKYTATKRWPFLNSWPSDEHFSGVWVVYCKEFESELFGSKVSSIVHVDAWLQVRKNLGR